MSNEIVQLFCAFHRKKYSYVWEHTDLYIYAHVTTGGYYRVMMGSNASEDSGSVPVPTELFLTLVPPTDDSEVCHLKRT